MKKASSMSKDSSNLSKSRSRCYFRRSLVNFKNLILNNYLYGSWKSWRGVAFDSEHIKNDS